MSDKYFLFYIEDDENFIEEGTKEQILDFMDIHFDGKRIRFSESFDDMNDDLPIQDVILVRGEIIEDWDDLD